MNIAGEKRVNDQSGVDAVQHMIEYIEAHLLEELSPQQIAAQFYMSVAAANNVFKIICGMPIMEYVRNRRLTLSGKELLSSDIHIIDLAYKYGYETPEAFTKAFTRFHGLPPSMVRRVYPSLQEFNPMEIKVEIMGGWALIVGEHSSKGVSIQEAESSLIEGASKLESFEKDTSPERVESTEKNTSPKKFESTKKLVGCGKIRGSAEPANRDTSSRTGTISAYLTKANGLEQEGSLPNEYDKAIQIKGGVYVESQKHQYLIKTEEMQYKHEWEVLTKLAGKFDEAGILFKVDGKSMIFAHGLEFKMDKIRLTFKWHEEEKVQKFFHFAGNMKSPFKGCKYFDTVFEGMMVRCMFYGDCAGDTTDEFLFRNTDTVEANGQKMQVQSLEFYYENGQHGDEYYKMVEDWLKKSRK